ncbi:MAG: glutamate-1-semialdehyde 2,1-aminomutase [Methanomassiliicoccales archaeon]|nr:glutamate-1-semialdehyde 2,1-aminomutase [Methanomassiliicoccales archaeon]
MGSERSRMLYERAHGLMPGGVSSPVRASEPFPLFIKGGKGATLFDVDGNRYSDYCLAYGPLILGHAHPRVVEALRKQAGEGTLYGAPTELEVEMASLISSLYPSMPMMRFVSSGTEATMHALRLARGFTGRSKIIKIEGAFHGAHDSVLVKAGSGAATHGTPDSLGVPEEVARNTLLAPYNDLDAVERLMREQGGQIAALIVEPVLGNIGPVLPREGYLQGLRELTSRHDLLLIFDEVITGFRLAMGGAQEYYGVRPDITVLGKIAGGGLPIGIFGASEEIMSWVSPLGKVYQAGTFNGNPMSMTAGLETLRELREKGHEGLFHNGERMRKGLQNVLDDLGLGYKVQGIGPMYQLFLGREEVWDRAGAMRSDATLFKRLYQGLLHEGVYIPPSQFETCFLSTAHSQADIDRALGSYEKVLRGLRP